ncbi:hypothetical protein SRHO_G00054660 [Serrasalmus rhombeus]
MSTSIKVLLWVRGLYSTDLDAALTAAMTGVSWPIRHGLNPSLLVLTLRRSPAFHHTVTLAPSNGQIRSKVGELWNSHCSLAEGPLDSASIRTLVRSVHYDLIPDQQQVSSCSSDTLLSMQQRKVGQLHL